MNCEKCNSKTVLMIGYVNLDPDQEPYEAGQEVALDLSVEKYVTAQYCQKCDSLTDITQE